MKDYSFAEKVCFFTILLLLSAYILSSDAVGNIADEFLDAASADSAKPDFLVDKPGTTTKAGVRDLSQVTDTETLNYGDSDDDTDEESSGE